MAVPGTRVALLCADLLVRTVVVLQGGAGPGILETDVVQRRMEACRVHPLAEKMLLHLGYGVAMRFDIDAFGPPGAGRAARLVANIRRSTLSLTRLQHLLFQAARMHREEPSVCSPFRDLERYPKWNTLGMVARLMGGLMRAALRDLYGSMQGASPVPLVLMNLVVTDKCTEYRLVQPENACLPLVFGPKCIREATISLIAGGSLCSTTDIKAALKAAGKHGRVVWKRALSLVVPGFHPRYPMQSGTTVVEWE